MIEYHSIQNILDLCKEQDKKIWEVVLQADMDESGASGEQVFEKMRFMYRAMQEADQSYEANLKSQSGMVGGDGEKMRQYNATGKNLCSEYSSLAMEKALKMGESNACMKRIVAAPTAGACGVMPAVLVTYYKEYEASEETMLQALYVAAGIGQVIASRASLAGASGGCQAEIGSASGMAAAAICSVRGGSKEQMGYACAMALKNLMGLVCDPVAGLVEVPCVKRNVGGAVNALAAADMALAGIASHIPVDQVIDAMGEVGMKMDVSLRETSMGGVATSPKGLEIAERLGM